MKTDMISTIILICSCVISCCISDDLADSVQFSNCFTTLELDKQRPTDLGQIFFTAAEPADSHINIFRSGTDNNSNQTLPSTIVVKNLKWHGEDRNCPTTEKTKEDSKYLRAVCSRIKSSSDSKGWHVLMWRSDENMFFCQGALIDSQYIVTTAHCLVKYGKTNIIAPSDIKVKFTQMNGLHPIEKIHVHKMFNYDTFKNNIALLKLKHPLKYNEIVHPICLQLQNGLPEKSRLKQHWWEGDIYEQTYNGNIVNGDLSRLSKVQCKQKLAESGSSIDGTSLTDNTICTGNPDYCAGDLFLETVTDGSPLTTQIGIKTILVGMKSTGSTYSCTRGDVSHIFTNLDKFHPWIETLLTSGK